MGFWLRISIYQSGMVHEGSWVNCPTRVGHMKASTVCWTESTRRVKLSGNQAAADNYDLRWEQHIQAISTKGSVRLYFSKQLKRAGFGTDDLLYCYCSVIRPVLENAYPVWSRLALTCHRNAGKYWLSDSSKLASCQKLPIFISYFLIN